MNTAWVKRMGNHTCVISRHSGKTIKPFFSFPQFSVDVYFSKCDKGIFMDKQAHNGQLSLWLLFSSALERTHAKRDGSPSWLLFRKPDLLVSCLSCVLCAAHVTVTWVTECKISENIYSTGQVFGKLQEFSMIYCVYWLLEYDNTQVSMKTPESLCCSFDIFLLKRWVGKMSGLA